MPCGTKSYHLLSFSPARLRKETQDTRYQCSLHFYAPRHSCFVPPHTIRSEDTYQNADMCIVIGRVVSTLAGLASPSGPIAAGTVQTVPASTNSPASKRYSHHAPQKPTVTLSPFTACPGVTTKHPWKDLAVCDSVGGRPWEAKAGWGRVLPRPWIRCFEPTMHQLQHPRSNSLDFQNRIQ